MKKALVIKTSSMGDVIHTLPALSDAGIAVPDIRFDWVVEEGFAEIPAWHARVDKVLPVALRRWRKHWWQSLCSGEVRNFLHALKVANYDYIIDAQGLLKSAIIAACARGVRCGYDAKSVRERLAAVFYQQKFNVAKEQHAIDRLRQLFAQILKYELPNSAPNYGIRDKFLSKLASQRMKEAHNQNYVVFVHSSSHEKKCWIDSRWFELSKLANDADLAVYLVWGNKEELLRSERIAANKMSTHNSANAIIKVMPKLNLTELSDLLIGSCGVVAVDTGLGHLAAALGVPTVSLYGPTKPALIGTIGEKQEHLTDFMNISAFAVWQKLKLKVPVIGY
jgi:heptosyltransferase I